MFEIKYHLIEDIRFDISTLSSDSIRYNFCLGNLILSTSEHAIEMNWEWIPLLDFSLSISHIYNSFNSNHSSMEVFEFTESEERLFFKKDNEVVTIQASFSDCILSMSIDEFAAAINCYNEKLIPDIERKFPAVRHHIAFIKLVREIGEMLSKKKE
jgi:hypothetical protein